MKSRFSLAALAVICALLSASRSLASEVLDRFTYQGQLRSGGIPFTGTCQISVGLWDSLSDVSGQVGGTFLFTSVPVTGGLFTLTLNNIDSFGTTPFDGNARWLSLAVKCGADGSFTPLIPRQELHPTPYAAGLAPGALITGSGAALTRDLLYANNTSATGSTNAIHGNSHTSNGSGLWGTSDTVDGLGIAGNNTVGTAIWGANSSLSRPAVKGTNGSTGNGVLGTSTGGDGVHGTGHNGVFGTTSLAAGFGVYGENTGTNGTAIKGVSAIGIGVEGSGFIAGVNGIGAPGVRGTGLADAIGVVGLATGFGIGLYGQNFDLVNGQAGTFDGNVSIQAGGALNVGATGTKIKRILAGTATVGSNGSSSVTFTVTFASAFSGVPHALAIARNDPNNNNVADTFVVSIREIKTNLVTFNIIRIDTNTGWGQNLLLDWMAWE
jgi:hypothetical protein